MLEQDVEDRGIDVAKGLDEQFVEEKNETCATY
jgi:hypothetical protein